MHSSFIASSVSCGCDRLPDKEGTRCAAKPMSSVSVSRIAYVHAHQCRWLSFVFLSLVLQRDCAGRASWRRWVFCKRNDSIPPNKPTSSPSPSSSFSLSFSSVLHAPGKKQQPHNLLIQSLVRPKKNKPASQHAEHRKKRKRTPPLCGTISPPNLKAIRGECGLSLHYNVVVFEEAAKVAKK